MGAQPRNRPPAQPRCRSTATTIGGVVTSRFGPEAGVWVIAETTDLGTKFAKIVVTDERGRYVIPDLPQANYNVWVRGYGLVDSPKVRARRAGSSTSTAVIAPNAAPRPQYYPADLLVLDAQHSGQEPVPGTPAPTATACRSTIKSQEQWST